jgi:DNA-binding LacI/PurR family transcriptional regulator
MAEIARAAGVSTSAISKALKIFEGPK